MEPTQPKAFYDENSFDKGELKYHIKLKKGDIAKYVLLPGDPKRVGFIASYLDNAKLIADYREYVTVTGEYKGIGVSIVSTGIGGPSTAIAVEELIEVGGTHFIRVGTSGGLNLNVVPGDLVIAQGAIKDEGTSSEYIPIEYPALADVNIVKALKKSAENSNYKYHVGVVHSKDCFYGELEPEKSFFRERFENNLNYYTKAGALASEMECAALFSVASLRRVSASGIMYVVENTVMERLGTHTPYMTDIDSMIKVALDAIVLLDKNN